jgi:ribonucleoside-diphosphate reductase alpha chain
VTNRAPLDERQALAAFDEHAVAIAKRQYQQPGDEDLIGTFRRVADWVAHAEPAHLRSEQARRFFELMLSKRFCPGGRVLAGAATNHGNVLNCFVQDGRPEPEGSDAWVLRLATKLAVVTKVGGGNGLCLDPIAPKRPFDGRAGQLHITIAPTHPDFDKVRDGIFMDLVHGTYVTRGYRAARFVDYHASHAGMTVRQVGDSVESIWQHAADVVTTLLRGEDLLLDLSELRPEGTPVHGSGGTSSGPSSFAVEVFDNFARWAQLGGAAHAGPVATLRYVFAPTLRVIRQGGTRRGAGMATMSITHPDVRDFITAKDLAREREEGDISTFNISVLVSDDFMARARAQGPGEILHEIAEHAWRTGEPGLIYLDRINAHNPMRASLGDIKATNPCVTADTWVMTHRGPRRVRDLIGVDFCAVVDGLDFPLESDGFFKTGTKPVVRLRTEQGFEVRLTRDHRVKRVVARNRDGRETEWCEAGSLVTGDEIVLSDHRAARPWSGAGDTEQGWVLGLLVGGGAFLSAPKVMACLDLRGEERERMARRATSALRAPGMGIGHLWRTDGDDEVRLASDALTRLAQAFAIRPGQETVTDEIERAASAFYRGFLQGLFDADASVEEGPEASVEEGPGAGVAVRLAQSDEQTLLRVQRMLARLGVIASVQPERGGTRGHPTPGQHALVIAGDGLRRFAEVVGFSHAGKRERLERALGVDRRAPPRDRFAATVRSVEDDGVEDVFDVTVADVHAFDANGIVAHNCGEIPLFPGEPCDLGAINLAQYVAQQDVGLDGFDMDTFRSDVHSCVRFLDDVLEVNTFALDDNREMSHYLRRLGLGIMGLADALIRMGYRYDSEAGREATRVMITALREAAVTASRALAEERGPFPGIDASSLTEPRRNIALLTVAPTGTTSMLMGVSSGVEPIFAPFIYRKIGSGYAAIVAPLFRELLERHAPHPRYAKDGAWDWEKVVERVQQHHGSVQALDFVPDAVKAVLVCAHDIAPADHVRLQGVVQSAFDAGSDMVANSISKTINLPNHASEQDVYDAYVLAFESGCKGITVYRDGSRDHQVLSTSAARGHGDEAATLPTPAVAQGAADAPAEAATASAARPAPAAGQAPVSAPQRSQAPLARRTVAAPEPARPAVERLPSEPLFDRPTRLEGFTDAVKLMLPTGEQRGFYVTVNKQDGLPVECFITSGKAGDEANADSEALGRVVSIALQYGVPAEALVKTLRGINGSMYGTYQGRMVASRADLIAVALETAGVENVLQRGKRCPDCGAPLRFQEGCMTCESCGYSKCG